MKIRCNWHAIVIIKVYSNTSKCHFLIYYHVNFRIMLYHLKSPCWSPVVMRLGYVHLSEPKKNLIVFKNIDYQSNIDKISHKYYHALVFVLVDGSFVLNKVRNAYT